MQLFVHESLAMCHYEHRSVFSSRAHRIELLLYSRALLFARSYGFIGRGVYRCRGCFHTRVVSVHRSPYVFLCLLDRHMFRHQASAS